MTARSLDSVERGSTKQDTIAGDAGRRQWYENSHGCEGRIPFGAVHYFAPLVFSALLCLRPGYLQGAMQPPSSRLFREAADQFGIPKRKAVCQHTR